MKSNKYWIKRAEQRMIDYMENAEKVASEIGQSYFNSTLYIQKEIESIFNNFTKFAGVSEKEAYLLLKHIKSDNILKSMRKAILTITDPALKAKMLLQLSAPAYRSRIDRLQALHKDIEKQCNEIYNVRLESTTNLLSLTVNEAYYHTLFDIQKGVGYAFNFASMSNKRVNEILKNNWSGSQFSQRIWKNTKMLENELKSELIVGFMSGKSNQKMADKISEVMGTSNFDSRRLIRTETCYVANQSEIESYTECGIKKYRYVATLDSRTSPICQEMDGKEIPINEAETGINVPPLHPFCRSTTIPIIDETVQKGMKRRAKDKNGKTQLVDANMTYKEWTKKQI